jgi:hypothetical protein
MSKPKNFDTLSLEEKEAWRVRKNEIARKSYENNCEERKKRVRAYKHKIYGIRVRREAKKKEQAPRYCSGYKCSKLTHYKTWREWMDKRRLCKSCLARGAKWEKQRVHLKRRFYKMVAADGDYGRLELRVCAAYSDEYRYAKDFLRVGEPWMENDVYMVRGYCRSDEMYRGGRPSYARGGCENSRITKKAFEEWERQARHKKERGLGVYHELRRKRLKTRKPRIHSLFVVKPKPSPATKVSNREMNTPSVRSFFQFMAGIEAVAEYVKTNKPIIEKQDE